MHFMQDGMPVTELQTNAPEVLKLMVKRGFGKTDHNQTVQFCGLVSPSLSETAIFLPKGISRTASLYQSKMVMRALAQYGSEIERRQLEDEADTGTTGLLSVIAKLAADFRENGFFTERQRLSFRNAGKPEWAKTVRKTIPLGAGGNQPVYSEIYTSRAIDTRETLLGRIHAAVLREISDNHGWWLDGMLARRNEFQRIPIPSSNRRVWPTQIRQLRTSLYASRSIKLANLLIKYLEADSAHDSGNHVFGLNDFHSVWERMLAATLPNVFEGMNEQLPFARYQPHHPSWKHVDRFMRTDIIAEEAGTYYLLDAKYYLARDERTLPGWSDVAKQIVYEQALRTIIGPETQVVNAFVFPTNASGHVRFTKAEMVDRSEGICHGFPTVRMYGIDIMDVMSCYLAGSKIGKLSGYFPVVAKPALEAWQTS